MREIARTNQQNVIIIIIRTPSKTLIWSKNDVFVATQEWGYHDANTIIHSTTTAITTI